MTTNASTHQYLNHDWATQLEMLKVIYDNENITVKYLDDENEEIGLNNQDDYNNAIRFAVGISNNFLRLALRDSKGNLISKPNFKIDVNDIDMKRIFNPKDVRSDSNSSKTDNEKVFQTQILAELPNEKQNWLVSYLEQLKKDIVKDMEDKIKNLVMTQSTAFLNNNHNNNNNNNNENEITPVRKNTDNDLLILGNSLCFAEKTFRLLLLLSEAKLSERPIKVAFLEEELQLSGALNAIFVKDLTMPDGTKCLPETKFQKKWLIKNTGKLAWNTENFPVRLVCIAGNIATQNDFVNVENTEVDNTTIISVDLMAPSRSGEFFSEWVLVCHNFQFGPRIWASIEVVEMNESTMQITSQDIMQSSSLRPSHLTDELEDEFVVVPDCFDLNKNWKSRKDTTTNKMMQKFDQEPNDTYLDSSYQEVFSDKSSDQPARDNSLPDKIQVTNIHTSSEAANFTRQPSDEKLNDLNSLSVSLKEVLSSQPIQIPVNNVPKQSVETKSPSAFNMVKDAFAITNDALSNLQMPSYIGDVSQPQKEISKEQSSPPLPNHPEESQPKPSPVSTITSVSKSIGDAFGSLGSVYQTGGKQSITSSRAMDLNMEKLISMGFANRTKNKDLLIKYGNDIDKVIVFLLEQQESNYR